MSEVVVYSKDNCTKCRMVKKLFGMKDIEYKEINFLKDEAVHQKLIDMGIRSAPYVTINDDNGESIFSFSDVSMPGISKIESIYNQSKKESEDTSMVAAN